MQTALVEWLQSLGFTPSIIGSAVVVNNLAIEPITNTKLEPAPDQLYFFPDEWKDRQEQCKALILAKLGKFERRIGARECTLAELSRVDATEFLDKYHLQGSNHLSLVCFGLLCDKELVGVMSLGRHSRQIAQNRIVLDRLCFKGGVQVVGGASKLFKRCVEWAKDRKYDEIISFSDNRWTAGGIYKPLGFTLEQSCKPDYCYVKDGVRYSKQSQQKNSCGCPETLTELEWASYRGLVRVYDAGKKRWILNLNPENHETRQEISSKNCAKQHQRGTFKHSHMRGYFLSQKNSASIYFGSSYELRCIYRLESDPTVSGFRRCDAFKGSEGWRNPDLWVTFADGHSEAWEVKPTDRLVDPAVAKQLADSAQFAQEQKVPFRVWTEKDSGLKGEHEIISWARKYLAEVQRDTKYLDRHKQIRKNISIRYYERHFKNDLVEVPCEWCNTYLGCSSTVHKVQRKAY